MQRPFLSLALKSVPENLVLAQTVLGFAPVFFSFLGDAEQAETLFGGQLLHLKT
jgi:hypothetical protein